MQAAAVSPSPSPDRPGPPECDERVRLAHARWADYERLLEIRGERSVPRIAYLEGEIELMSPSLDHEWVKTTLARLVETWAYETGFPLHGYGSWTLKDRAEEAGLEPDECYKVGPERKERPDLAIEVWWTRGGINKLEIYRRLRVREVWMWSRGAIVVHALRGDAYEVIPRSEVIPELDLDELLEFLRGGDQDAAVRAYGRRLRDRL